ncbi:DNA gyrase subunit A [Blochmannia endosymbiont of Camponotus sp. C-003]|uniref:DNA gyrase subunit A n=1 Tax=unclassified Candidatus Blochmanniella TaxID=711328 RepID=UPI00202514CB|nr:MULTISPECIES: DNA gyrase subunit A [unclassified Candidatus Blochmannia]URJ23354.1 DNA gyrase subunit A [Blochmannia endosymbiont of Camponotus sp. C-003]URJ28827.1 DNA gyrase subunit A [Blochmannia endosymbiont of Camponotus sp. C-046]
MNDFAKEITQINIEEELTHSYLDYAMSVIVGRALPDVRDGLKPVHRRILFAMQVLGNCWNRSYKKSARVVGDVIGKYHPHGDTAVYETIVRMAQPFLMRYALVDGQGNFGSVDGDSAAAMRYTEVRMSKIANELLLDLDKETVDYELNYDGTENIPGILPARIPNLLVNGSSGIAVGMATNIPPHNLSEVINGCLAFIDNEDITIAGLMKYIPGPDFPTAAIINDSSGLQEAYSTGRGKIYIRARAEIETDIKSGRESIVIYEIPYQVNKARLLEKITELVKLKRIEGIYNLRDESDKDGMRIVIEIKRDAISEIILNNLYSLTSLQTSFGINMVALHQGQPKIMSLKDILSAFVSHRRAIVVRRVNFELKKARGRIHILEGLAIALFNIDAIIELIRHSNSSVEASSCLTSSSWKIGNMIDMTRTDSVNLIQSEGSKVKNVIHDNQYYLTKNQVQAILDLKLHKLTTLEHEKLLKEYSSLLEKIENLISVLKDPKCLMQVIRQELLEIQKEYNDPRRTEISNNVENINVENLINQKDVVVTLSYQGYVKYQPLTDYEAQKRGGKGKLATRIKEEDFITRLLIANTHDTVLLFSNYGRIYWMKVYRLPEASRGSRGKPIINLLPLDVNERITAILPIQNYTTGHQVFMATSSGVVKKTPLVEFSRPRNVGIIALNLNDGDELIGADITDGSNEVMLFTAYGKVVRFKETQVRSVGRSAIGVKGIHLLQGDRVVSLIIPKDKSSILTVTRNGFGKRTNQSEYPIKSRATQGVISIKVTERNGNVVGAVQVNQSDQIVMITDLGRLVRTRVSEVNIIRRNTQGVMLIRTACDEYVVGLQCVVESVEN